MSTSALFAARKRAENALKNFQLSTQPDPTESTDPSQKKNATLLLSLLQSRLNWANSVFVKYRADNVQQPRRTNNSRKKWPNMRFLGTCTLQLGPHRFSDVQFFEAIRKESWLDLAKAADLLPKQASVPENGKPSSATTDPPSADTEKPSEKPSENPTAATSATAATTEAMQTDADGKKEESSASDASKSSETAASSELQESSTNGTLKTLPDGAAELTFSDVVMEFKETTNERFLFPKDMILELTSMEAPFELLASFLLPLDPAPATYFELDAKEKIARWGSRSNLELIKEHAATAAIPPLKSESMDLETTDSYAANIRMIGVNGEILKALVANVTNPDIVRQQMMSKMEKLPVRSYLNYATQDEETDRNIDEMLHKIYTAPEIISGPVLAEKKRNEILNAVNLGKRPRPEEGVNEVVPKAKHTHVKDDGLRKCVYCSTKHTAMWRPGPAGHGTLCNGCGLLWRQGKILKGAPVISIEEEKRLAKERREQQRKLQEEQEKERLEQEKQRLKKKAEAKNQQAGHGEKASLKVGNGVKANIGYFAAQLLHQQHQQQQTATQSTSSAPTASPSSQVSPIAAASSPSTSAPSPIPTQKSLVKTKADTASAPVPKTIATKATTPSSTATATAASNAAPPSASSTSTSASPSASTAQPSAASTAPAPALSLYNTAGIPLPTLSIDFGGLAYFAHPNCGVTLVDGHFSIRLSKEGLAPIVLDVDKRELQNAGFMVTTEDQIGREVLIMTCSPSVGETARRFDINLIPSHSTYTITIRFLEKLDPSGGAVVKRILERWLSTYMLQPPNQPPTTQTSSSSSPS
ncbi:uncharacterized protein BYT42DRAFT_265865 [Radiomyces spectabilis]|uniref:uncharacterized protein n=1 Tax=Radiomyces spectabilis TaxID=64574 RepID=UPI00221F66AB|nr:uncharacterized protein BYT42DRAFT_265865 [Radiomyces spectabilis]KAI8384562.1 hypothetical protein BYT42DRAFT_265865 [Radiomyces spectabilis]